MSITKVTGQVIDETTNLTVGIITAAGIVKSDGSPIGNTVLTIGVRVGTAVTFRASGVSFDVLTRNSGNVPISL